MKVLEEFLEFKITCENVRPIPKVTMKSPDFHFQLTAERLNNYNSSGDLVHSQVVIKNPYDTRCIALAPRMAKALQSQIKWLEADCDCGKFPNPNPSDIVSKYPCHACDQYFVIQSIMED